MILLFVFGPHFLESFPDGFRKEMQSTLASGEFISKWQEALMENRRLALNPFGWKRIRTADLLLPGQVLHLAKRQHQFTSKNKCSLTL